MSDAISNFLANYTETITVPEYMPLVCLVRYLFLEFDDQEDRVAQLTDLFYGHDRPTYFQKLQDTVHQDQAMLACFEAAMLAAQDGAIERYDKDFDFDRYEKNRLKPPEFYTVSFLTWAQQTGIEIPEYITAELGKRMEYYFDSQYHREQERLKFPEISRQEFDLRTNEPLWKMTDALLYALGHESRTSDDSKINFLKYKDRAKRLMAYALDAQKAQDLKLLGFNDHLFDTDQTGVEEKRAQSFYASQVKPKEFVTWLKRLALDVPILDGKVEGVIDNHIQAGGYSTPYIDLIIKAIQELKISHANQPPKKNIVEWLEKQNPELSKRETGVMATIVRLPEMKKGGYHSRKEKKGDTQ